MAEDDKYVPSGGNPKLDPTNWVGNKTKAEVLAMDAAAGARGTYHEQVATQYRQLAAEGALKRKEIEDFNASQEAGRAGLLNRKMMPEGYEIGDGGVLRNKGYKSTKGYQAKEMTKMARAHITERTWGKYNREEAKKSQITASISPDYGQFKPKSPVLAGAAGPVAGGLVPWISRFSPTACGPVLVSTYGFSGGVFQSNTQEAINNGICIII